MKLQTSIFLIIIIFYLPSCKKEDKDIIEQNEVINDGTINGKWNITQRTLTKKYYENTGIEDEVTIYNNAGSYEFNENSTGIRTWTGNGNIGTITQYFTWEKTDSVIKLLYSGATLKKIWNIIYFDSLQLEATMIDSVGCNYYYHNYWKLDKTN